MEFGAKNNKNILLIYEKFVLDQWNIFAKQPKDHWSIWINKKTLNNSGSLYLINPKDSLTSLLFLNIKYFLYLKILHDFIMMDRLFNYKFPVGRSLNYHRFYLNFINLDQLRYYLYMNQQYSAMFGLLLADRQKRDFKNIKNFYNFLKSYNLRTVSATNNQLYLQLTTEKNSEYLYYSLRIFWQVFCSTIVSSTMVVYFTSTFSTFLFFCIK